MTEKVVLIDHMGSDLTVVNAARVSFDKHHKEFDEDKDAKLIGYLAKNGHWTPFAHPVMQFRFTAPIFIANQLKRHQIGFALNEVSRRYVDDEPTFTEMVWRKRPEASIKQGSGAEFDDDTQAVLQSAAAEASAGCAKIYRALIEAGVAPEQARSVLPQSMNTSWYWTGSLYAWSRMCRDRLDAHAQVETREYAVMVDWVAKKLFPVSWAALMQAS